MKPRKRTYRSRAVVGVWIASMLVLMVAMLGWAMDMSYVAYVVQQLQVAADGASLAGAGAAKTDLDVARLRAQATGAANTAGITASVPDPVLLNLNEANLADGDIVTGRYYRWDHPIEEHEAGDFVPTSVFGYVNAVKVVARRTDTSLNGKLPLLFGPIFGVDTTEVSRDAIAMVGGASGAGLIVLCPDCECALDFSGTTQLTLANAPGYEGESIIQVNSDATGCSPRRAALCANGTPDIVAPGINLVAEGPESYCLAGLGAEDVPPINPGQPFIPDPLAGLPEPVYTLMPDRGCIRSSGGSCFDTKACSGGLDEGNLCANGGDCSDDVGTCAQTGQVCGGGPNSGAGCTIPSDCEVTVSCDPVLFTCTAGPDSGSICTFDTDCGNWPCDNVYSCTSGPFVGAACADPLGNECTDVGTCNDARTACAGGTDDGLKCTSQADCPGGACMTAPDRCKDGDNHNGICSTNADCPGGGECLTTVWVRPGYYPGGFRVTNSNFRLILSSGVYSLDHDSGPDSGLYVNGGNLDASAGVMFHIVNDGVVYLGGNGTIIVNPIDDETNIYNGISMFQSRTNYLEATIIGTDDMLLAGTYYFPNNKLSVGGVGLALGNQLIAWEVEMHGTGEYTILYDGEIPAPGYKVWLVQ